MIAISAASSRPVNCIQIQWQKTRLGYPFHHPTSLLPTYANVNVLQAKGYSSILDPLTAPDPSDETGPGSHFRSTFSQQPSTPTPPACDTSNPGPPPAKDGATSNPMRPGYPTSPSSARRRTSAFAASADGPPRRSNTVGSNAKRGDVAARHRSSSLGERFPGDDSNRPLDILRRESRRAYRSPHLKKKHLPGVDLIDRLDDGPGSRYHHEGPYDAALISRNASWETSPLAAVSDTIEEALKATPHESVLDAVERHRPLDGTAVWFPLTSFSNDTDAT